MCSPMSRSSIPSRLGTFGPQLVPLATLQISGTQTYALTITQTTRARGMRSSLYHSKLGALQHRRHAVPLRSHPRCVYTARTPACYLLRQRVPPDLLSAVPILVTHANGSRGPPHRPHGIWLDPLRAPRHAGDFALRDIALLRSRPTFVCAACAGPLVLSLVCCSFQLCSGCLWFRVARWLFPSSGVQGCKVAASLFSHCSYIDKARTKKKRNLNPRKKRELASAEKKTKLNSNYASRQELRTTSTTPHS
jgi:hypothetical protein